MIVDDVTQSITRDTGRNLRSHPGRRSQWKSRRRLL